jgi:hypothetical protein
MGLNLAMVGLSLCPDKFVFRIFGVNIQIGALISEKFFLIYNNFIVRGKSYLD